MSRALADCGRLQRTPVAKDWNEMARLLTSYEDEMTKFESRTPKTEHLAEGFKREAIWHMVPDREKDLHRAIKENTKTYAELRLALDHILSEKTQGPVPMQLGAVDGLT